MLCQTGLMTLALGSHRSQHDHHIKFILKQCLYRWARATSGRWHSLFENATHSNFTLQKDLEKFTTASINRQNYLPILFQFSCLGESDFDFKLKIISSKRRKTVQDGLSSVGKMLQRALDQQNWLAVESPTQRLTDWAVNTNASHAIKFCVF